MQPQLRLIKVNRLYCLQQKSIFAWIKYGSEKNYMVDACKPVAVNSICCTVAGGAIPWRKGRAEEKPLQGVYGFEAAGDGLTDSNKYY